MGYLGQVDLVEEAHLEHTGRGQHCDLGGARRMLRILNTEAPELSQVLYARRSVHPPVAHHHDVLEPETPLYLEAAEMNAVGSAVLPGTPPRRWAGPRGRR